MENLKKYYLISAILFLAIIIILIVDFSFLKKFNSIVSANTFSQNSKGVEYTLVKGKNPEFKMIIGDVLGVNPDSYDFVKNLKPDKNGNSWVIFPGFQKGEEKVNEENFLEKISNANGVIIADNFCTADWDDVKNKEIYKETKLTSGPFCLSETESNTIAVLIKRINPSEVILPYDVPLYKDYIANFTKYFEENGIKYELIQIDELKKKNL